MKKQIEQWKCNNCDKIVEQSEPMYGGSPFSGWICLTIIDGGTRFPRQDNVPLDFCCKQCCVKFLLK